MLDRAPWVQVSPEAALAHPKGRPGLAIHAVALWLLLTAALNLLSYLDGGGTGWMLVWAVVAFNAAWLLALGSFWGWLLGVVVALREIVIFIINLRGLGGVPGDVVASDGFTALSYLLLAQVVLAAIAGFYLLEGDRPNLIFRHRFRKYSEGDGDV